MKRQNSGEIFQRAQRVLVGGTNSPVRSFKRVGGTPLIIDRGQGAYLFDVDGNRYVDFVMSYGPHLFGHGKKELVEALHQASKKAFSTGFTSELEVQWAEALLRSLPHSEKVRALTSGTEACATAIRLARGITKRNLILKCAGHYHGHVDSLLVDGGSGLATLSSAAKADSEGLPQTLTELSRVVEFNSVEALEKVFREEGSALAAFILEPVMGNMGVVPPTKEFLDLARKRCSEYGALFICDEVMTGFRVHAKSAQGLYGISPDLSCFGKIVGGGLPLAALTGPAQFMDQLAPLGSVYQAGTLSGNPLSISVGLEMLRLLEEQNPYAKLETIGAALEKIFIQEAQAVGLETRVERVASMMSVYFRGAPVKNASDSRNADSDRFTRFFWQMLEKGYLLPPSPFEAFFLSTEHEVLLADSKFQKDLRSIFEAIA